MDIILGDYCKCSSKKERNDLLKALRDHGLPMISRTLDEMDVEGDYEYWPCVCYIESSSSGNRFTVNRNRVGGGSWELFNEYTVKEFMEKAGIIHKSQGRSKLEFIFR